MNAAGETDNKLSTMGGPLPGLLGPPLIFLAAIFSGVALGLATPFPIIDCSVARTRPYCLCRISLPAFVPRISPRWHLCAALRAHDYDCADRSVQVQP